MRAGEWMNARKLPASALFFANLVTWKPGVSSYIFDACGEFANVGTLKIPTWCFAAFMLITVCCQPGEAKIIAACPAWKRASPCEYVSELTSLLKYGFSCAAFVSHVRQ